MKNKVYALTVLNLDEDPNAMRWIKDQRLWFLFEDFSEAEQFTLANKSDIFECYYNYAVIEEVSVISRKSKFTLLCKEWWYFADFSSEKRNGNNPFVTKCLKPKILENTVNFYGG